MNSGIYKIANGMCLSEYYLGSAVSFSNRFPRHKSDLKNHIHHNYHLQEVFDKYGLDNLVFEIIEYVDNKEDLISREQYYIDTLKPVYNICKVAGNKLGTNHSKETKDKITKAMKDKKNGLGNKGWTDKKQSEEHILKRVKSRIKSFKLLSSLNTVIEEINISKFCRENNLNQSHISEVINGSRKSHKGWTKSE